MNYLISKGWDADKAMALDDVYRMGFCIQHGQNEGGVWDWDTMSWKPRET